MKYCTKSIIFKRERKKDTEHEEGGRVEMCGVRGFSGHGEREIIAMHTWVGD